MKRNTINPRDNWQSKCDAIEFNWHTVDGVEYWRENACYEFTAAEVDAIEAATQELHDMCMEHVKDVVERGDYAGYNLSTHARELVEQSWRNGDNHILGRFDLALIQGDNLAIKMLEYNADTPTSLYEAAVVQWRWLEDLQLPDQFNSIHEKLVQAWREQPNEHVHFCAMQYAGPEDWGTVSYIAQTAADAGKGVSTLSMEDIGWDGYNQFLDLNNRNIDACFKLYPWEWLMQDQYGLYVAQANTAWYEPAWKMLLSTKALLPLLYAKHPNHPNLLPSYFDNGTPVSQGKWIRKPLLSREGANIAVVEPGRTENLSGENVNPAYAENGYVLQEYADITKFDGYIPVIGSWVIGDNAAGMGIREDQGVTGNRSCFVPHYFV